MRSDAALEELCKLIRGELSALVESYDQPDHPNVAYIVGSQLHLVLDRWWSPDEQDDQLIDAAFERAPDVLALLERVTGDRAVFNPLCKNLYRVGDPDLVLADFSCCHALGMPYTQYKDTNTVKTWLERAVKVLARALLEAGLELPFASRKDLEIVAYAKQRTRRQKVEEIAQCIHKLRTTSR